MKKSQLERLIRVELEKILSEGVGRAEAFPGQNALARASKLCKEALDPAAKGAQLDQETKNSFLEIQKLVNHVFNLHSKASGKF